MKLKRLAIRSNLIINDFSMEYTIDTVYLYQCCFGKYNNFSISISFSIHDKFILVLVLVKFNYNFSFSISFRNQKLNNISSSFSFRV